MKTRLLIAIAVCLIVAGGAWAQFPGASPYSPRTIGMSAGLATVNDAASWSINPAALATLRNMTPVGDNCYASDVMAVFGNNDDFNTEALTWSGWCCPEKVGIGAGYINYTDMFKSFGAGVGTRWGKTPLTVGANFEYLNGFGTSDTLFNIGLNYDWTCGLRTSLVVDDVLAREDDSPFFDFGAAKCFGRLLLAADVLDITDRVNTTISGGAEYALTPALSLRAGVFDSGDGHDLSAGLGYCFGTWRVDGAWQNLEGNPWLVSLGHSF